MTARERFLKLLAECPLIAIIRGIEPHDAEAIGDALFESGIRIIEVPLNSPDPLDSIARLGARFGNEALIGAGTVLQIDEVAAVRSAGGQLIVSPSTKPEVITAAAAAGMASCPGFFTPSEAFSAIDAGADALKLFPAEGSSPAILRAMRAVLPRDTPILVVGGVMPETTGPWLEAGAKGFGLGSGLYRPGQSSTETARKAKAYVESVRAR